MENTESWWWGKGLFSVYLVKFRRGREVIYILFPKLQMNYEGFHFACQSKALPRTDHNPNNLACPFLQSTKVNKNKNGCKQKLPTCI